MVKRGKTSITALGLHGFIMVYHTKNVISPDRPVDQKGVACATSSAAAHLRDQRPGGLPTSLGERQVVGGGLKQSLICGALGNQNYSEHM